MALSALLCPVCRGGVECKLHENRGEEREEGKEKLGVDAREGDSKRGRMDAKKAVIVFVGFWGKKSVN